MNCFRSCRSSLFGFTVKLAIFWLTNGDNTSALMTRSKGPIQRPSDSPLLSMAYALGANGYLDKLSNGMLWDELVRTVARYWVGMNITPNSLAGQANGFTHSLGRTGAALPKTYYRYEKED
jgi:hypothetical protein